jgi:hypothetical protein
MEGKLRRIQEDVESKLFDSQVSQKEQYSQIK